MVYRESMPTNKLWIEHTERAAWDSVEALRERLLKAESRLQALASGIDRLPELLDLLDEAKQKYAPDAQAHAEVVAQLLSRIERLQGELDTAKAQPTVVSISSPLPLGSSRARLDSDDLDQPSHGRDEDDDLDLAGFAQAMQRRSESVEAEPARDLNRLLSLADSKLDDLSELDGAALREAALELAILAGRIYGVSRTR
jgi:hypothetical protein